MTKFKKGDKRPENAGRKKGTPNKSNAKIREAFQLLIEGNLDKMDAWIAAIAKKDPKGAMDLIVKLSEFYLPKLSRTELKAEVETNPYKEMTTDELKSLADELRKKTDN